MAICCKQARQSGTLDAKVSSLLARTALFQSLDLIPLKYTTTASSAAVQAAANGGVDREAAPAACAHPSYSKQPRFATGSGPHKVRVAKDVQLEASTATDLELTLLS
jgi:hypothetical protein